jgi:predicted enzyme related to lactoylglutathione lyase
MNLPKNALDWFEIPVVDFERAKKFYSAIFAYEMPEFPMPPNRMGILPCDFEQKGVGGAISLEAGRTPSTQGTMVYLGAGDDLSVVLNRVEAAGGKVVQPKTLITPEIGYCGVFKDTEGNHVGLHSKA